MAGKVLFTTTPEQRREAFVRSRFAEFAAGDQFGRPDIIEWLAAQRIADQPDDAPSGMRTPELPNWHEYVNFWSNQQCLLYNSLHGRELEVLYAHAIQYPWDARQYVCDNAALQRIWERARQLLTVLARGRLTELYQGTWCTILANRQTGRAIVLCCGHRQCVIVDELRPEHVIDVFLETWREGSSNVTWRYGREKSVNAREFLCDALAAKVELIEFKARDDFFQAVAVSDDGTRIIHADHVLVPVHGVWMMFPARSFYGDNKIKLVSPQRFNEKHGLSLQTVGEIASFICPRVKVVGDKSLRFTIPSTLGPDDVCAPMQGLVVEKGGKKFFFTHSCFCPDPLPEGGVAVIRV